MPEQRSTKYIVRTLPSGKKVKQTISSGGRITKVTPVKTTRTAKRLNNRRRRINR